MAIVNTHYGFCAKGGAAMKFTYTGEYNVRDDGVVELLTSGNIVFLEPKVIDVFMVGGGGAGKFRQGDSTDVGGGGGGGYTKTVRQMSVDANVSIPVTIGAGGVRSADYNDIPGGTTSMGNHEVGGGYGGGMLQSTSGPAKPRVGGLGGSGGGGGVKSNRDYGAGGSDGENGEYGYPTSTHGGNGQGFTTREFGEATGKLYAGGGGGGRYMSSDTPIISMGGAGGGGAGAWAGATGQGSQGPAAGVANTGGGGGGGVNGSTVWFGATGGSGIVCFRDAQELPELAGTWVLNERLYKPEFGPSAIGKQTSQIVTFTAGSETFTSFVFFWPSANDNNMYYQNSAKTIGVYNFVSNKYIGTPPKTITFPAGATASNEFRVWLASNATKQ